MWVLRLVNPPIGVLDLDLTMQQRTSQLFMHGYDV